MAHYEIENELKTTLEQRVVSWLISIVASALILFILYFAHISIPNPPFENKKGVLELDFGMIEDPSFGRPTDGGPSPNPPKIGGNPSQGPQTNQMPSGGQGEIITNEADQSVANLPPIDPPTSDRPASENPKIKVDFSKIGKRNGKGGEGDPNGLKNGIGSTGSGKGGNKGGVTGNYGDRVTTNKGKGLFSHKFGNYDLNSTVDKVDADGVGPIVARVSVDCNGIWKVTGWNATGTNYSGSDPNMKMVFTDFLRRSHFTRTGDKCPESALVTLNIKKTY